MTPVAAPASIRLPPALDLAGLVRVEADVEGALGDPGVRVLLLHGDHGVFCRGMDLEGLAREMTPEEGVARYGRLLQRLRHAPKPVIAAVDGEAVAGGIGFIGVADLAIATTGSTFGLPEALFGLLPAIVLAALAERVAPQKARLWTLAARTLDSDEARQIGVVDELVPGAPELDRAVRSWSRRLAKVAPGAVASLKARQVPFDFDAAIAHTSGTVHDPSIRLAIERFFRDGETPW
jgi:enoyl-CoA hydratase/carnithine racemase